MAAAEKVCELTGEYPSYKMYNYKRNSIQVMPNARKQFAGKDHALYIFNPSKIVASDYSFHDYEDESEYWEHGDGRPFTEQDYINLIKSRSGVRITSMYHYVLHVPDLQGNVKGRYMNWSYRIGTVKRKLKRMLKCRKLNVVRIDTDYNEWKGY